MKRYLVNSRASVTLLVVLLLPVLVLSVGGVIDYGMYAARKARVESALEGGMKSALAEARLAGRGYSIARIHRKCLRWTRASLGPRAFDWLRIVSADMKRTKNGGFSLHVRYGIRSVFLRLVGIRWMWGELNTIIYPDGASGSSGDEELHVVFAIDTSAHMRPRFSEMQRAVGEVIGSLYTHAKRTGLRVRVGLVPFAQYVNVSTAVQAAPERADIWLEYPPRRGEQRVRLCRAKRTCLRRQSPPRGSYCYSDQCRRKYPCLEWSQPQRVCKWVSVENTWRGCVGSRDWRHAHGDSDYAIAKVPAVYEFASNGERNVCPAPVRGLTLLDRPGMKSIRRSLFRLRPRGGAYLPDAYGWARRALSGNLPYAEAREAHGRVRRVIVVVSAGVNTVSNDPGGHDRTSHDIRRANRQTLSACTIARGQGGRFAEVISVHVSGVVSGREGYEGEKLLMRCGRPFYRLRTMSRNLPRHLLRFFVHDA